MATQLTKTVDETTDQVISLIEQAQDAAVSVVKSVSETIAEYLPEIGIGEALLTPEDAVEAGFRTSNKFAEAARKAAVGMVQAVAPVTDKVFGTKKSAPKAVAKSA